jgi:hypothetical protein
MTPGLVIKLITLLKNKLNGTNHFQLKRRIIVIIG